MKKTELESIKEMTQSHLVDGIIMLRVRENDESVEYLKNAKFSICRNRKT